MRLGLGLIVGLWAACSADVDPDTCAVDRPEGSCPSGATCEAGRCRVDPGDAVGDALADWTAFREWAEPRDLLVDRHPVSWSDVDAWVTPRIDAYRWRPRLVDAWSIFREAWRETEAKHLGEDAASVALASAILRTWADEVVEAGAVPVVVLADVSGRPRPRRPRRLSVRCTPRCAHKPAPSASRPSLDRPLRSPVEGRSTVRAGTGVPR